MSHLLTVVLVIAICWFSVALAAGIVLGTFIRRASALALVHERPSGVREDRVSVPADRIRAARFN